MSIWLDNYLKGRTIIWGRRGILAVTSYALYLDYSTLHYNQAFDPEEEGSKYVVDVSGISRRSVTLFHTPHTSYSYYSLWAPKNGDVVTARECREFPNYLQLVSGHYVERTTCGVELLRPLAQVESEKRIEAEQQRNIEAFMNHHSGIQVPNTD